MNMLSKLIENKEHHMLEAAYDCTEFHWTAIDSVREAKKQLIKHFMHPTH